MQVGAKLSNVEETGEDVWSTRDDDQVEVAANDDADVDEVIDAVA